MVSTLTRPIRSEAIPPMNPPSTAPIRVTVASIPDWPVFNPKVAAIAASEKLRINRSKPSIAYPTDDAISALAAYRLGRVWERVLVSLTGLLA